MRHLHSGALHSLRAARSGHTPLPGGRLRHLLFDRRLVQLELLLRRVELPLDVLQRLRGGRVLEGGVRELRVQLRVRGLESRRQLRGRGVE